MDFAFHPFECKLLASGDAGAISGHGAVFNNVDEGSDVIEKGAFSDSLKSKANLPMLMEHRDTIGVWNDLREDQTGLKVRGQISDTQLGRDARTLATDGALTGLSIGYRVVDSDYQGSVRILRKVDLMEISLVTFPMNTLARVASAKTQLRRGDIPDTPELELFLRNVGFSRRQVKRLFAYGLSGLTPQHTAAAILESMAARLE